MPLVKCENSTCENLTYVSVAELARFRQATKQEYPLCKVCALLKVLELEEKMRTIGMSLNEEVLRMNEEELAIKLHEAGRKAVLRAREGRRIHARYLLNKYNIELKGE